MFALKAFLPLAFLFTASSCLPALKERDDSTTCGSTNYTGDEVDAAASAACSYYQSGTTAGDSTYPHTYNDYEGFTFPVSGPYLEFPILSSGEVYSGGSPGPDRVVINTSCQLAGDITHTGASGNDFVGCSGTS